MHLVLCMIVRDESAVIERCLKSAFPIVDGFVICDTGSQDDTVERARASAERAGIPGQMLRHQWVDFGRNRTMAAMAARRFVQECGWAPDRTYLLLLDADMVLHVDPVFDSQSLTESWYDVLQDDGVIQYRNPRLICLRSEWEAVGPTHEYWRPVGAGATGRRLDTLLIEDRADGGNRESKYERDINLLREALRAEPENSRCVFYLAQSFFETGRWAEAADWYGQRWRMEGWAEEGWYARYREGLCLLKMGERERGAGTLLEAFDERPERAEPLWALARHYRELGKHQAALPLVLRGLEIPYPAEDVLFVERQVYEWRLWEELMICAYHSGPRYLLFGLEACERLLAQPGHNSAFYDYVAGNEAFYLPVLASRKAGRLAPASDGSAPDVDEHRLSVPDEPEVAKGLFVFSCRPLVIGRRGESAGETDPIARREVGIGPLEARCDIPMVSLSAAGERWITLVREILPGPAGPVHAHRWLEFDAGSAVARVSRPFAFEAPAVESADALQDVDGLSVRIEYQVTGGARAYVECAWKSVRSAVAEGRQFQLQRNASASGAGADEDAVQESRPIVHTSAAGR
ncbi:MAG: hypothetical protein GEU90_04015 [Gemmatimonas sp.]|nr:hypothetical protein [Gemmatimonas sp.]